jgi:biotin carboxyl carrier protein
MTFEVEVGGRTRSVSVERAGGEGQYRVAVDGQPHAVTASRTLDGALLLAAGTFPQKVPATSADKSQEDRRLRPPPDVGPADKVPATFRGKVPATHEVFVTPSGTPGEVLVTVEGRTAVVTVNGRRAARRADAAAHAPGDQPVVAPMPGRVVRVLVAPGDQVAARQGVIVVEAMKMENELRAPKAGRVKDVSVSAGTSVEAGRVLVVIE